MSPGVTRPLDKEGVMRPLRDGVARPLDIDKDGTREVDNDGVLRPEKEGVTRPFLEEAAEGGRGTLT